MKKELYEKLKKLYPINTFSEEVQREIMNIVESAYYTGRIDAIKEALEDFNKD